MKYFSADVVYPICSEPIAHGIVVVHDNGVIEEVLRPESVHVPDASQVVHFKGALCPGFVNAHCHLELSHMKGLVPEKTGLPRFIMQIVSRRNENAEMKMEAIRLADEEMWQNGIQAVGDICNTADTLATKKESKIDYHSFVEVFSFDSSKADEVLAEGIRVANEYQQMGLKSTIVPHAPYSVSERLFAGIRKQQSQFPGSISIHNQETESENEMFVSGSGELVELFEKFGEDFSEFQPRFSSSLDYHIDQLPAQRAVFVHNTMTQPHEFDMVKGKRSDVFWCACAWANRYIENQMPNVPMWFKKGAKVCVGTDSLASNHQLSILEELKLIQSQFPQLLLNQMLEAATLTGAKALQMENKKGSFQRGKLPGVLWLKNVSPAGVLSASSSVERIM